MRFGQQELCPCYPTEMPISIYKSLSILTFRESVSRKGYFFQTTSVDSSCCTWTGSGVLPGPIQNLATGVMVMPEVFVITVAIIVWSIYRSVQRK